MLTRGKESKDSIIPLSVLKINGGKAMKHEEDYSYLKEKVRVHSKELRNDYTENYRMFNFVKV